MGKGWRDDWEACRTATVHQVDFGLDGSKIMNWLRRVVACLGSTDIGQGHRRNFLFGRVGRWKFGV